MRSLRTGGRLVAALFLALTPLIVPAVASAATPVSVTEHRQLGFQASVPFTESKSDSCCFGTADYSISISGTANVRVALGVDVTFSYDPADVLPNGSVPISVTYTPTNDAGSEVSIDVNADIHAEGCVAAVLCDGVTLNNVDVATGSADFAAPLPGDASVTAPLTSDTITLSSPVGEIASAALDGSFTLAPVAAGSLAGLGGAAAVVGVSGATLTSPVVVPGVGVTEWDAAGQTNIVSVQLGGDPTATVTTTLSPVLHWLSAEINAEVDVNLASFLNVFFDDFSIGIFSGSIGSLLSGSGVDTLVSDAIAALIGFDPGVGANIAAGRLPFPLTSPEVAGVPPLPGIGAITFSFDPDSDDDGLTDGEEATLGTDPFDADTDNDGLTDGQEVESIGTDPLDPDTDDDGLLDGIEVNGLNPTNPFVADTDGDGLLDGIEDANHNGALDPGETDPNVFDTDGDGLGDGLEVQLGTDPLNPDTDGDGIPDGEDTEFLDNALDTLADSAFKGNGHRNAIHAQLAAVEHKVAMGHVDQALDQLAQIRTHLDGCGTAPDNTDWVVDCGSQVMIRGLLDLLVTNLTT